MRHIKVGDIVITNKRWDKMWQGYSVDDKNLRDFTSVLLFLQHQHIGKVIRTSHNGKRIWSTWFDERPNIEMSFIDLKYLRSMTQQEAAKFLVNKLGEDI